MADVERIKNGPFNSDLDHWDDKDVGGTGISSWVSGKCKFQVSFAGHKAAREQIIVVQPNVLCTLNVDLDRTLLGLPFDILVGSTSGDNDIFSNSYSNDASPTETFTPTVTPIYLRLQLFQDATSSQWTADNVSLLQANPDADEFPKKIIIL